MSVSTIIIGLLALISLIVGYLKGNNAHIQGIKIASSMLLEIAPLLIFAFILSGMCQALIPQSFITKFIGRESGLKGIFFGAVAGGLFPGGPYVSLPIAAGLIRAGASIGTVVAFLTGWSLWALSRLPMEIGIIGWKMTLIRIGSTFLFPPIAGMIAKCLFER